ncbi:MAG: hypothetical protein AB7N91_21210 [Candidatus Tectimicrobiota bacterium]
MPRRITLMFTTVAVLLMVIPFLVFAQQIVPQISMQPASVSSDTSIKYDYPIVYVRVPRWLPSQEAKKPARWAEFSNPFAVTPGSDLMLLRPDGSEELLVPGGQGAIQDPYVSFDGAWVFYTKFHVATNGINADGADIYKIHVKSRKIVQLTRQEFTLNKESTKPGPSYGVYNIHPCPVPGGRVAFVSNRNGFLPPPKSYPQVALQLHIMDDDGNNVETIGELNRAGALHPVILQDGRLIFSSLENMGLRNYILWGIWGIHPDGTHWEPIVSALHGYSAPPAWHFQTQLSDGSIIVEMYYNQNQKGFGTLFKLPPALPPNVPAFGPANREDRRNPGWEFLGSKGRQVRMPFTPYGMELLTPWINTQDTPALPSVLNDPKSPRIGKVTHPCGAPDNHLLLAWSPGPIGGSGSGKEWMTPQPIDSGIYLLKKGQITQGPGEMVLIKDDPNYNEQWPRPLVTYKRIYGVDEPRELVHKNHGKGSPHLPEGSPFGLVGTASLYKRETAPLGTVPEGSVTAVQANYGKDKWSAFTGMGWNWNGQGADAGRYDNSDIHAIRILAFEPNAYTPSVKTSSVYPPYGGYPLYKNHAMERLRILGEIPVRHFDQGKQLIDPDGNPDTSFLAKIPADVAFTFQAIDKNGMDLTMSQTWHQLRPGESRYDCGGCHAHSQNPTVFAKTAAARPGTVPIDLTKSTPLLTSKAQDESGKQWDTQQETGLRFAQSPQDVEYWRDIRPIFDRSCTACHTKQWKEPAGGLVLDDDATTIDGLPGTYFRLAHDQKARFSPKRLEGPTKDGRLIIRALTDSDMASHYIWKFQSRRSLLIWKIYGKRLDGWSNADIPGEELARDDPRRQSLTPGSGVSSLPEDRFYTGDIDYTGTVMPPPQAVEGTYKGPGGQTIKVAPLTDEDRRTIVRWIDLGCLIDLAPANQSKKPKAIASSGLSDDQRPTLTLTYPEPGVNAPLYRILIGMHDYDAGLDLQSLQVVADFPVDGLPSGQNLASRFQALTDNRWEWRLSKPITELSRGKLVVSVKDNQSNMSKIERIFSVSSKRSAGAQ